METPAAASASPAEASSNLLRRQGAFEGADFVRLHLRSGCRARYLHAAEDGRSVRLHPRRESHNAVWAVMPNVSPSGGRQFLLRSAYGRYLGATARGSLCYPRCRAAEQCDFVTPQVEGIMWRAVATTRRGSLREGAFLLQDDTERYLRANSRCLLPCCSGVHVSDRSDFCTATKWAVERVPRAGRPELPIPPDSLFARLCPPLSRLCVLEREIRWVRADNNGVCSEDEWPSERYTGRGHDPPEESAGEPASPAAAGRPAGLHSLRPRRSLWAAEPFARQPTSQPGAARPRACRAQHSSG